MSRTASLAQLVADVQAVLEARSVTVPQALGRKHLEKHGATTRIVWVPKGGSSAPAIRTKQHPNSLATRLLTVEAWIFAEEYAQAERLLAQVHAVLRSIAVGSFELRGEAPPPADSQHLVRGEVLIATFQIQLPLDDFPMTTATITGADVSPDIP
jgi:hypothetical protein